MELRDKLAPRVIAIKELDLKIDHRNGPEPFVPDTSSRKAKPLCQLDVKSLERSTEEAENERMSQIDEIIANLS